MRTKLLTTAVLLALASPASAVDLMGVYELASENDPTLRAAEHRLDAAEYGPRIARSSLLPSISASVSRSRGRSETTVAGNSQGTDAVDSGSYGLELRQSIYDDANYGELTRSRAELAAADAEFDQAWQDFLLRVSERYFDVLTAQDSLRFAESEETALRRQFEQAEQRYEVGLSAVTDFLEARAAWDAARARVIVADNTLADAREALREITGTGFDHFSGLTDDIPLERPEPANSDSWVDQALQYSPEYRAQLNQLDVVDADIRIARAGHLPTLNLVGSVNQARNNEFVARDPETQEPLGMSTLVQDEWRIDLVLDVPLFEGFAVQSRTRQARVNRLAAGEDLDQVQRAVVRDTENAYRAVEAGLREVEAREQALISAESALEATNAGFEVGTRTIVDVLQSEQNFYQAQRNYSEARHQFILNHLRLRRAAGVLQPEDLASANQLLSASTGDS